MDYTYGIQGQIAPELRVPHWIDGNGKARPPVQLADYPNKVKYLYCFQSWCLGCHSCGFPTLQRLVTHYSDKNPAPAFLVVQTVFEGYSSNGPEHLIATQQRYELDLPFAQDDVRPSPYIMTDYYTGGTPWIIIIGRDNRVIYNDFRIDIKQAIQLIDTAIKNPVR